MGGSGSGARAASKPPVERKEWVLCCDFHGTDDEFNDFVDWLHDEIPDRFIPKGPNTGGMDGSSGGPASEHVLVEQREAPYSESHVITKSGRVLTDEDVQVLADEAEAGYEVKKFWVSQSNTLPDLASASREVMEDLSSRLMRSMMANPRISQVALLSSGDGKIILSGVVSALDPYAAATVAMYVMCQTLQAVGESMEPPLVPGAATQIEWNVVELSPEEPTDD